MDSGSILIFSDEKGFGELFWLICPVCWNSMKVIRWEDGTEEEACPACKRMEEALTKEACS